MAKYLVETYYTCTFKVNHYLDDINEKEMKNLEKRIINSRMSSTTRRFTQAELRLTIKVGWWMSNQAIYTCDCIYNIDMNSAYVIICV